MAYISVIIPTYNCSAYIIEAINSITTQTRQPDEIIIIDDGSTDDTQLLVNELNNKKIKYIRQPNAGVSKARNQGLLHAKGDYIAFLDADDRWLPTMLEEQHKVLEHEPNLVFCFTNFVRFVEPEGTLLTDQFSFYPELNNINCPSDSSDAVGIISNDAFCTLVDFGEIPGYTQAILFRKAAIVGLEFNEQLKICEDAEFVLKAAARGKVAFNRKVLLEVRRHQLNATSDISLMAVHKLNAFLSLNEVPELTQSQRNTLKVRILKSYLIAAVATARKKNILDTVNYCYCALKINGHALRKAIGLIRVAGALILGSRFN